MLHDDWKHRLWTLIDHGEPVGPRGLATHELLDQQVELFDSTYNLLDVPARKLNYRFAVAEWVWMMFGHSDVASLAQFNAVMRQFSDDGIWLTGAYGPHIKAQRHRVLEKLRKDPNTRQAVIEIPRPYHAPDTKDEPCTLSFQFLLRNGALHLIATMRSSDAWLGIPYDVFTFTQIQNCFAGELGVRRGWFRMNMGSSHLYTRDIESAVAILHDTVTWDTLRSPDLPGLPPAWLEDFLTHREQAQHVINGIAPDDPWLPYARVLLSNTSDEARLILRKLSRATQA